MAPAQSILSLGEVLTIRVSERQPREKETEEPTKEKILNELKSTTLNDFTAVVNQREEALMRAIFAIRQNSQPLRAHYQLYPFPLNGTQSHSPDFIVSNVKVQGKYLSLDPHSFPSFDKQVHAAGEACIDKSEIIPTSMVAVGAVTTAASGGAAIRAGEVNHIINTIVQADKSRGLSAAAISKNLHTIAAKQPPAVANMIHSAANALVDVFKWKSFKNTWGKNFFIVLATDQSALRSMLNTFNVRSQEMVDTVWNVPTLEVSDKNLAAQTERFKSELINLLRRPETSISQNGDEVGLTECIIEAQRLRPVPRRKSEDERKRERLAKALRKEAQANNLKVSFRKESYPIDVMFCSSQSKSQSAEP